MTKNGASVGRRNIIKSISAGALGINAVPLVSGETTNDTTRIPTIKHGDRVIQWKVVPAEWREQTLEARSAVHEFKRGYLADEGITGVGLTPTDELVFGDYKGFQIEVEVDRQLFSKTIPDTFSGVTVKEIEPRRGTPLSCHNLCDFDPIPGGVTTEGVQGDIGGTSGFAVENLYGDPRMLTANHLFGRCDQNDVDSVYQNATEVGSVELSNPEMDIATVQPDPGTNFSSSIETESASKPISGAETESGVEELAASDEPVQKMGIATGITTGEIEKVHYSDASGISCVDFDGHGVVCEDPGGGTGTAFAAEGDSGGPIYHNVNFGGTTYAAIIGTTVLGASPSSDNPYCDQRCIADGSSSLDGFLQDEGMAFYHVKQEENLSLL